jgi:parallel beta-helix repeat protein
MVASLVGDVNIISETEAVDRIVETVQLAETNSAPFVFIIGAGFSRGLVPTVEDMVKDHLPMEVRTLKARTDDAGKSTAERSQLAGEFWREFVRRNEAGLRKHNLFFDLSETGFPKDTENSAKAYQAAFDHRFAGALNEPKLARNFLRKVMRLARPRLNTAHFFLGSLLGELSVLEDRRGPNGEETPRFKPGVALSRLILTTNFDPFLQTALQFVGRPYYVSDRAELELDDIGVEPDSSAVHLVYVHGSIHRRSQISNESDIKRIKERNAEVLRNVLKTHGVIVLGYSGWDDAIVEALVKSGDRDHRLYWCGVHPDPLASPSVFGSRVPEILSNPLASYVPIQDAGMFTVGLCKELVGLPRLLINPIRELRDRLDSVDLAAVNVPVGGPPTGSGSEIPTSPLRTVEQTLAETRARLAEMTIAWASRQMPVEQPSPEVLPSPPPMEVPLTKIESAPRIIRQGDSLAEAVRAAQAGDLILVHPGTYEGGLVIDKELQVIGVGEPETIRIEASGTHTLAFSGVRARVARLTFCLRGGGHDGTWSAVDIAQGHLVLEECCIESEGFAGIAIHGPNAVPEIRGNRIRNCRQSGVIVFDHALGTLEDNDVSHNKVHGVVLREGAHPVLRKNHIHHNQRVGVHIEGGALGHLEDNDIFANGLEGITILDHSDPLLQRNHIYENTKAGVYIFDAGKGKLEENVIRSNQNSGVAIRTKGDPILQRNHINFNNGKGIWCRDEAAGTVKDNDLKENRFGESWVSPDCTTRIL